MCVAYTAEDRRELGARLKGARTAAGLTLQRVAATLAEEGFPVRHKQTVGHWETGLSLPDVFVLRRLAKLYGQPLDALVWSNALSIEALQIAADYESLSQEQRRTFRAVWLAFVASASQAEKLPAAPKAPPVRPKTDPDHKLQIFLPHWSIFA